MARLSVPAAVAAAFLAVAGTAAAKGPSEARIEGPGLRAPLVLKGWGENGEGALGALTMDGGFFALTFGQSPDTRLPGRPGGDLGPRYAVDYTVPAGDTTASHVLQDLYPYASGGPVLHLAAGQTMFAGGTATVGGWVRGPETLLAALAAAGLPATPPQGDVGTWVAEPVALAGAALALLAVCAGVLALFVRRSGQAQRRARGQEAASA